MRKWPPLMLLWIWGLFALVLCTCQGEEVDIQAVNRMEAEGIWETKSLAVPFSNTVNQQTHRLTVSASRNDSMEIRGIFRLVDISAVQKTPVYPALKAIRNGTSVVAARQEILESNGVRIVMEGSGTLAMDSLYLELSVTRILDYYQDSETQSFQVGAKRICKDLECRDYINSLLIGTHQAKGIRETGRFSPTFPSGGNWIWSTVEFNETYQLNQELLPFEVRLQTPNRPFLYANLEGPDALLIPFQEPFSGSSKGYSGRIEVLQNRILFRITESYRWSILKDSLVAQ